MRFVYVIPIVGLLAACTSSVVNDVKFLQASNSKICTTKTTSPDNGPIDKVGKLVSNIKEFDLAVSQAKPGDTIVLKNGTWSNCEMLIEVSGRKLQNITVTAETKGKVIFSGQSWLRIGGNYIHVDGLVFKNGYSPGRYTITFQKNSKNVAHHSRISEIVIDNYSNSADLNETKDWVNLSGTNNRVDHSYFANKKERGAVINVSRPKGHGYINNHLIDHNYFGVREYFGANGAEIIRVGSWPESQKRSETIVEKNIFYRTGGEAEIISLKSGGNVLRDN